MSNQKNWLELLDIAQFSCNIQKSYATGHCPFELVNKKMPVTPHTVVTEGLLRIPHAKKFMKAWDGTLELARVCLHEAARRMKKWADEDRRDAHFNVGDMVFLKIIGDQFQPPKGTARSLTRKYEGPFRVKKRVGEVAYELELLHHMHMKHLAFHVNQLKRCGLDVEHPERVEPPRGPAMIVDRLNLVMDKIMKCRTTGIGSHIKHEFLFRWKDTLEEHSWETGDSLCRWKRKIVKYDRKLRRIARLPRTTMTLGGGGCNALRLLQRSSSMGVPIKHA